LFFNQNKFTIKSKDLDEMDFDEILIIFGSILQQKEEEAKEYERLANVSR
jgi:hypothetical protein